MKHLAHRGLLGTLAALAFVLAGTMTVSAQSVTDNVKATKHNFSATSGRGAFEALPAGFEDYGEICVYCHTPHGGSATAPLWNRSDPVATGWTMYTSSTLDMTRGAGPSGVSLACMSCHDGTVGIDVITNEPAGTFTAGDIRITDFPNLVNTPVDFSDKDLSNDHPIAVQYDLTKDSAFVAPTSSRVGTLPLYGTNLEVQCGSCHNPHEAASTKQPFLRMSNAQSALCLTCHIK